MLFVFLTEFLSSCLYLDSRKLTGNRDSLYDLDEIRKSGKLIAVTDYNSTNYFIYRGETMGFHYELLKSFSDYIGVDLEIITENDIDKAYKMLETGSVDLMAFGLSVNSSLKKKIRFTDPLYETRQVLVQRKQGDLRSHSPDTANKMPVRDNADLVNKTIYVQSGSAHIQCLKELDREIDGKISFVKVPYEAEALIKNVATGEIDFTVSDENVALVNSTYYNNLDVSTPISSFQKIGWGVRKNNSEVLVNELNAWLANYKKKGSFALIYAKYFKNSRANTIFKSDYYALTTGKVSKYDEMIKKYSAGIEWDWRLLAALICQESRFDPDVESGAGAYGLMQIMPVTGENFGIDITASPENNMKAGIEYINWLHSIFDPKIPDEKERMNFILAAYNAGPGHVLDAMKLAEKNGMDPLKWEGSVAIWLLKKSDPLYYKDDVVKSGFFRGTESVAFVSEILDRYEHYKNIIPEYQLKE